MHDTGAQRSQDAEQTELGLLNRLVDYCDSSMREEACRCRKRGSQAI